MANKAFKIVQALRKDKVPEGEILTALRSTRSHHAEVLLEVEHCAQRRNGRKSANEILGFDWRRLYGFGRPLVSGLRGTSRQPSKQQIAHATKRVQRDRLRFGDAGAARIAFAPGADTLAKIAAALLGMRLFIGKKQ